MTQQQLERSVAHATGESIRLIRNLGFSSLSIPTAHRVACENPVVCPMCRRPVPSSGTASDGSTAMAECLDCDVYFDPDTVAPSS